MDCLENLKLCMKELGPLLDLEAIYEHTNNYWSVFINDKQEIFVDHLPEKMKLIFSTNITFSENIKKLHIYRILLQYNALWMENNSVYMGLSADEKVVTPISELVATSLETSTLAEFLSNYIKIVGRWNHILQELSNHEIPAELQQVFTEKPDFLIKI